MSAKNWVQVAAAVLLALVSLDTPAHAQPAIEACDSPALDLPAFVTTTTIEIDDESIESIGFTEIGLNISHTWVGGLTEISVESPAGTSVRLHRGDGGRTEDFDLVYSDAGAENTGEVRVEGEGIPSPFSCECKLKTPVDQASSLADFLDENPNGDWELSVTNFGAFGSGLLNSWCVLVWEVGAVADLSCSPDGEDPTMVTVSFIAGDDYTSVEIRNFTDLTAGGDVTEEFVAGESYEITVGPLPTPQVARIEIVGLVDTTSSASAACTVPLLATPIECVDGPTGDLSIDLPLYVGVVEFSAEYDVADLSVDVDVTYPFISELIIGIAHPDATTVLLHKDIFAPNIADLDVTFWQLGRAPATVPYDEDLIVQPSGPGSLADLSGGTTHSEDGVAGWALAIAGAFDSGTVDGWTLCVYDVAPAQPPLVLTCEPGSELGTVTASGIAGAAYTRVRWFVDGEVEEDVDFDPPLEGGIDGITFTTSPRPLPSNVKIHVQGFVGEGDDQAPGPLLGCGLSAFLPDPRGLSCSVDPGESEITATWEIPDDLPLGYDAYEVSINGELIEVLEDGSLTSYTTEEDFADGTAHLVSIVGVLDDPPASSNSVECRGFVFGSSDISECSLEGVSPTTISGSSTIEVFDTGAIEGVSLAMEGTAAFFGQIELTLEHVDTGNDLKIKNDGHGSLALLDDYCLFWTDGGDSLTAKTDLDACATLAPTGWDTFESAFQSDDSLGDWTLTLDSPTYPFSLTSWCLFVDVCTVAPPVDFAADVVDAEIMLTWGTEPASGYSEVRVYQDGGLIETLDPDEESFVISDLDDGRYRFRISGYSEELECEASTPELRVMVGLDETCLENEAVITDSTSPGVLEISVVDAVIVEDVEITLDMEVGFTSEWDIAVTSPFGTRVQLHDNLGGRDSFHLVWSNREESSPSMNGAPYDCGFCVQMPHPGTLADYSGELSDGTWAFEFSGPESSEVSLLCLATYVGCPGLPPSDVLVEVDAPDVLLSWENNGDPIAYNSIRVERNGSVIAEDLDGSTAEYVDESPISGLYRYRVVAVVTDPETGDDCDSGSPLSDPVAKGLQIDCIDEPVSVGIGDVLTEIEVLDDPNPDELQVVVELSHTFVPSLVIDLESPDEDSVRLYERDMGLNGVLIDMDIVFADAGTPQPVDDYNDGGFVRPESGELLDLLGGDVVGSWGLNVSGGAVIGVLDEFCMQFLVGCDIERPVVDRCESLNGDGLPPIEIVFSGIDLSVVDGIQVIRDDVIIDELSADATEYLDTELNQPGRPVYRIAAVDDELECSKVALPCAADPIARFTVCEESNTSIPDDHELAVSGLSFEYTSEDESDVEFESDDGGLIDSVEVDVELRTTFLGSVNFWVMSPEFTTVGLQDGAGAGATDLIVTYSEAGRGVVTDSLSECKCLVTPQGPGDLSDFAGEDPEGSWALAFVSTATGTLDSWCIGIFPDELPLTAPVEFEFLRGDADNDGAVSSIPDALRILSWSAGAADAPPCMAAADVDGNSIVSAIPDGLRLLNWGASLAPAPPAPFPDCGTDPDDPSLATGEPCDTDENGGNDGGAGCATAPGV